VVVSDSTPSSQSYIVSPGSSGTDGSPSSGYTYIILNQ
jgi:hypothetical protein